MVPTIVTEHTFCVSRDRVSGSGFLWVVPTNTGIFVLALKLCGERRT